MRSLHLTVPSGMRAGRETSSPGSAGLLLRGMKLCAKRDCHDFVQTAALSGVRGSMSKAFKQWRYLYEKDTRLEFDVRVAIAVIEALDRVCIGMTDGAQQRASDLAK